MKLCEIMHGEKYGETLGTIPLSHNTVMRRIESMSEDIKEQLLTGLNAVQNLLFKSTNQQMLQDQLSYLYLSDTVSKKTSRKSSYSVYRFQRDVQSDIFKALNDYFTAEDISRANCVSMCTSGAAALTGHKKGFQS
jgi:hypothetical protein